jgi:hypothetical protein
MKAISFLTIITLLAGCKKSEQVQSSTGCDAQISYSAKVKSIFVANCTASGCHDGVDLPSLAEYLTAKDASQQIKIAVKNGVMPRNGILSAPDKAAIICWIDNGAKNN